MLIGASLPSFRDTRLPGIKRFVAEMRAAGNASHETNLNTTGINSWLSVYAVETVAKKIEGPITHTNLLAALRRQKTPIDLFGLVQFPPGAKRPAAYPRWR